MEAVETNFENHIQAQVDLANWFYESNPLQRYVISYAKNLIGILADDLAQEVVTALVLSRSLPSNPPPIPWVIRIIRNRGIDLSRKRDCQHCQLDTPEFIANKPNADLEILRTALKILVARHPEFDELVAYWWAQPTLAEHAAYLERSEQEVKKLRERCRKKALDIMVQLEAECHL